MLLTLVTVSLLGDIAPKPFRQPSPPPVQCQQDTDCVLSIFQGCCGGCCGGAPHAVQRGVNEMARCSTVDCAPPDCAAVRCAQPPDPASFTAACRAGTCVAVRKSEAPAECRVDADCTVVTTASPGASCQRSACGCCPVTRAIPSDAVVPLQQRAPDSRKPGEKPSFGLSTGGQNPPPAPNCSPCPAPMGGTAACQSGRCVLLQTQPPTPLPRPRPRPPG